MDVTFHSAGGSEPLVQYWSSNRLCSTIASTTDRFVLAGRETQTRAAVEAAGMRLPTGVNLVQRGSLKNTMSHLRG